jgi:hypothetical protein
MILPYCAIGDPGTVPQKLFNCNGMRIARLARKAEPTFPTCQLLNQSDLIIDFRDILAQLVCNPTGKSIDAALDPEIFAMNICSKVQFDFASRGSVGKPGGNRFKR